MNDWYPKAHGFESGGAGERSFTRELKEPEVLEFEEWREAILYKLAKANVPTKLAPDGTIYAKFGSALLLV